jgi:hypothetical protein
MHIAKEVLRAAGVPEAAQEFRKSTMPNLSDGLADIDRQQASGNRIL